MSRSVILILLAALAASADGRLPLRQNWAIRSSGDVRESGAVLSTTAYRPRGWYGATLPSTVLSALVAERVYPDPYFGMNMRSIPGTHYPTATNFSNLPMPPDSPFRDAWWYRTDFTLPAEYRGRTVWLGFDGINFRANVWLNGRRIASSDKMAGAWRLFAFDITAAARPGETNALAIEVFPPDPHDLAITFVDWNPLPPDKDMGIWRDVWVAATGPVALQYPTVATHLGAGGAAQLTVRAELKNTAKTPVEGVLEGKIESLEFSQPVKLAAGETRAVRFTNVEVANPRLWWPAPVGAQELYPLELRFEANGRLSDSASIQFGIREVTSEIDGEGHRLFHINGKNILIRGAGYTFDMLLRSTPERQEAELQYVRDMNLNTVRFEGKLEDEHFLELCDRMGILVTAGWCCCDHWERWQTWDDEDETIAAESLRDQLRRLARHPSVFNWMYGSDNPPPPKIEKMYLDVIKQVEWPNPYQSSATQKSTQVTGPTGVKMTGPYDYVAPSYWLLDTKIGGAHGFNTETGPGPAPPPVETLRRMLPADHLWPIDSWWDYHAGGGPFRDIHVFTEALDARYGRAVSLEDYARKAQVMAYEGHRAMFEAFGRNKYTSTGVIQWMLNNSWPGVIWHLYDWYLRPGGSYFGAKKGNEPLHVQYSYDDRSVVVVNSYYKSFPNLKVTAKVLDIAMAEKFAKDATLDAGADSSTRVFTIPELEGVSGTYFVGLTLEDSGKTASRNFYWLSAKPETLDWEKSDWYHTPTKSFADYTALNTLPQVDLETTARIQPQGATVTVRNPGRTLAFAVHLEVKQGPEGDEILPVLWEDNYFSLLPGEARQIAATWGGPAARPARRDNAGRQPQRTGSPVVQVEGWNVKTKIVP